MNVDGSWRDAEMEADLAAEQSLPTASPAAREALYARVMTTVAAPAPAPAAGAGPALALVLALAGGGAWLGLSDGSSPPPPAETSDSGAVSTAARGSTEPRVEPAAAPVPAPSAVAPAAPTPAPTAPARRAPARRSGLAAEQALLERARRALAANDHPAARAAIAEHLRRFPAGELAEERALLEVQALVRSGRLAAARARAERFRARFPGSLLLEALELALDVPPEAAEGAAGARFEDR